MSEGAAEIRRQVHGLGRELQGPCRSFATLGTHLRHAAAKQDESRADLEQRIAAMHALRGMNGQELVAEAADPADRG